MNSYIKNHQEDFEAGISHLKKELESLRTGRANPVLVENILVESYGAKTPLRQLASITVPEARSITIEPWDKTIIKDIEKAITQAQLGVGPVNEGNLIRITIPLLTEESRRELLKILSEKMEKTKISLRQTRDKIKEEIIKAERDKEITEDDRYDYQKELDKITNEYMDKVREVGEKKEKEVMTI